MLSTQRVVLREWRQEDLDPFFQLNSDPEVMRYFPALLTKDDSDDLARRIIKKIEANGWGLWACELKATGAFFGFVGLNETKFDLPFCPCIEVGWRLAKKYWGAGLATEAANACLDFGFGNLNLQEIVSFTATTNLRSTSVMKRIGMSDTGENFQHPDVDHPTLKEHLLYKIQKRDWAC